MLCGHFIDCDGGSLDGMVEMGKPIGDQSFSTRELADAHSARVWTNVSLNFGNYRNAVISLVLAVSLAGCASHEPIWHSKQRFVTIRLGDTASLSKEEASRRLLERAARVTVDHGYRYFAINVPSHPQGAAASLPSRADFTIRMYMQGEVSAASPGLWDAFRLLEAKNATTAPRS